MSKTVAVKIKVEVVRKNDTKEAWDAQDRLEIMLMQPEILDYITDKIVNELCKIDEAGREHYIL